MSPVVHDGRSGVKRKKLRGEMTMTLYWLVSSFLMREMEPQPVPAIVSRYYAKSSQMSLPSMTRVFLFGSGANCSAGVLN